MHTDRLCIAAQPNPHRAGRSKLMMTLTIWRATLERCSSRLIVTVLVTAHILLKVILLPVALNDPLQGDEVTYVDGGKALANSVRDLVSGAGLPTHEISTHVVGNGWFMPGMSALLTPLYVLDPDAGPHAIRLYMGAITLLLFLGTVAAIGAVAGGKYAAVLLVLPGLVPMWLLYSFTAWGDVTGGLLAALLIALLVHLWQRLDADRPIRLRDGVTLGALACFTLYARSSVLPMVLGLLGLAVFAILCRARGSHLVRAVFACLVAGATFAALLLPWSYAASRAFDSRVVSTTTLPISMAYTFGPEDRLCFGPCAPGNIWVSMVRYSAEVSRQTGVNQLDVQREMERYALRDLTVTSFVRQVRSNFSRYVFKPNGFERAFWPASNRAHGPASRFIVSVTDVVYFGGLLFAAIVLLWPRRVPRRQQTLILLTSLAGAALMTQPFVHVCSPRYWPVFAPLIGVLAASLLTRAEPEESGRWLWRLQALTATGWAVVVVAILLIGR